MNHLTWTSALVSMVMNGLVIILWPGFAAGDPQMSMAGFVEVGGTLNLPLAFGAPPMTIQIQLGEPAIQVPVQITASTAIESESGAPITLADGDRVKLDTVIMGGAILATRLELEAFPEVLDTGTASGLPANGVTVPLASANPVTFTLTLVPGLNVAVVVTENTKVAAGPFMLTNGATVRVDAVVRNMQLMATEVSLIDSVMPMLTPMPMSPGMSPN